MVGGKEEMEEKSPPPLTHARARAGERKGARGKKEEKER